MKTKIVGRWKKLPKSNKEIWVYDVYCGFTGLPTAFPFCTKWKIEKAGLTLKELLNWFEKVAHWNQTIIIKY